MHEPMCHGMHVHVRFGSFFFIMGVQQIQLMSSSLEAGDPLSDLTRRLSLCSHFLFFPQAPSRDHKGT